MAAKTPSTVREIGHANGARMLKASFTDIDDADTWTPTSITGVIGYWANGTNDPTTQASNGIDVSFASGIFTFYPGEDNRVVDLYMLLRS